MSARMQSPIPADLVSDTTQRFPRTMREAQNDPSAWWQSAEAAVAEETYIRAMFAEPVKPIESRSVVWAERAICLIAAIVIVWVVVDWYMRRG